MDKLPDELQAATKALIDTILAAEPFVQYDRAQFQLNVDRQAESLLKQLSASQTRIRSEQGKGGVNQQDIDALRALQQEAQKNQTIMEYARAQQTAINYVREINQEISQLIGMDFASLARQNCC